MGSAEEGSMPISGKGATNQDAGFNSQDIDEFLRGFQSVKVHEEDDSRHREDSALQDVPSVAEHVNGKLKLMCSYGGRILPRPSDGKLRYVGGQTRIISIGMGVTFAELMQKLANAYGESLVIKYQLPDEELDSLVSVTCDEDLQNMIEEHVRISGSSDGGRIRLFLSSMGDQQYLDIPGDKQNSHQQYFEAINDVLESSFRNSRDNSSKALNELSEPSSSPKGQEGTNKAFMPTSVQDVTNPSLPPLAMPFSSEQLAQQDPLSFLPVSNTISLNQHTVQDAPSSSVFPTTVLPSSDQPLSSVPIPLPASLPSPLTAHTAQSGMALFTDIPTNGEGLNYSSQSDLPYRFSEPVVSETSFQTHSAFSAPLDHREKLHGLDQQLNDVKLPIDHHEKLSQLQEKHELPQTIIDSRFDAQSLSNLKPIISEPLSSAVQPPWHETEKMQQLPQQNSTLVNLSSQQGANIGTANFRHAGTQGQVLSDSMLNDLHNVLSSQQTGHYIASADPTSLGFSVQPTYNYNDSLLYGEPVYNYNGQNGGVFGSPGTAAGYGTVSSEQGAPPSLFSNEQHYGMQSMLSNKQSSSPNEVFHQHASVSRYPESIPQVVQTTYERADVIQMPAYPGLNTMQDEMVSFNPFENDNAQGGGGNQQGKETDRMSPGLQHYTVSSVPAEYVPPSALYPYYHETAARIGETDPKIMEAGPRNQHISHGTGNDSIIQSKESYFDTHNTVEDSAAGGAEEKNLMNHAELLPPLSETLNASEYTRHMKDIPPSSYGNRALEPNSNAISQTEYPVRLPSSVVPPDDHLDAYAPNERNMIFGDVQGKVPEEKIQSPKEDCAVGGISEASRKPSLESKNNVVDDVFIQWSHMQPKSPSNTSLDAEGAKKSSTTDVAVIPEMVKPSDGLVSLLPEVPSSGSLPKSVPASSTALTDLSKLVPSVPGDTSLALSHAADFSCESLEEKNSTSLDLKHLTTEAAFQSPVPHSLGVSNGGVELEGAEADNEEESNIDGSDNDNPVSDAYIAEFEAVARGLQVIKNADLEELQELGSGTFGTVYHGKWKGTDVAIKRIKNSCFTGRPSEQEHMRADFWSEATLLAKLHHPNILAFYGVVPDGPGGTLGTVTEYMINGSLKHVLQRKDRPIDHRKRVLIAMDAAFGMEYLHSKNIVHFDLKCENLLVNMRDAQRPICKVGDFGLSKIKHQTFVSGGVRGTLPWIAPELLNGSSHMVSEKVDVYSFGIVMWELLTGEEPYANMHYGAIIGGIVSNTLRPSVPDNCDPHWRALMEACWSCEPTARPAFTEVVSKLRAMSAALPTKGQGQKQT